MTRLSLLRLTIVLLCLALPWPAAHAVSAPANRPNPFHVPPGLEPAVAFWTRVYTEVETSSGLIHDNRRLDVVYEVTTLPQGSRRTRERHTDARKRHYKTILQKLARGQRSGLSAEEQRVLDLFGSDVSNDELSQASRRLRFQLGQADKFRAGVTRSGAYVGHIRATLDEMGLPAQIAALPHVESSYSPHAYSRVGAAGLWQFTRSTGRRFMQVDHVVDERLDPYRATVAAARLLEQNYRILKSWPLAITAYNHGASGMRRAKRNLGTDDIETIVRKYRSRTFGFASRNFYVEFIAASRIAADPDKYFGRLQLDAPTRYETIELPFHTTPKALSAATGIDLKTLKAVNPALRNTVWTGAKYIPRGYQLRVPAAALPQPLEVAIASVPQDQRHARQVRDTYHKVRRGETLSSIAARYGTRVSELKQLNGLVSSHRIRAGQKLRLPPEAGSSQLASVRTELKIEPMSPPPDGRYTVRPGDTIWKIAKQFGMSERELIAHNGLRNRHRIQVGQVLMVSNTATSPGPSKQEAAHPQGAAQLTPARTANPELAPASDPLTGTQVIDGGAVAATVDPALAPALGAPVESDSSALIADPSDYTVATDGTIEVQSNETLGHFADWLGVRTSRIRSINGMSYGDHVIVHHRIRLDFSNTTPEAFEAQRIAYHRGLQESFFDQWEIDGVETHRVRPGDSAWTLSHRRFDVPLWLLRQYNPDVDFESLSAGTRLTVPKLKKRSEADVAGPVAS